VKVLLLARYGHLAASSRYRVYQYQPSLRDHGLDVTVCALLDDVYLRRLYAGQRAAPIRIARAYAGRILAILQAGGYDLIWLEKEALPWIPAWLESLLLGLGPPVVVDYDDAIHHRYDHHASLPFRTLLGGKIARIMRNAAVVVVANDYLATYARKAGAARIEYLPTVVDLHRYPPAPPPANDVFTVGWIGNPLTAPVYLEAIHPVLKELCKGGRARFVAIGPTVLDWPDVPVTVKSWSEATETEDIQRLDVGLMPLPDEPFERGKSGLKLLQYMACSRPVIASPVGVNQEIIEEGVNGFTATSPREWLDTLRLLQSDQELRRRMGQAGRAMVEDRYCLQVTAPRLADILTSVSREHTV